LKRSALQWHCCMVQRILKGAIASTEGKALQLLAFLIAAVATTRKGLQTLCLQAFMIGAQERTRTSTPLGAST